MNMTPIPTTYNKHGYTFTLFRREGSVAVYEQTKNGKLYAFEVVKIRPGRPYTIRGVSYPAAELLPSDREWGAYGKTFSLFGGMRGVAENLAMDQMAVWTLAEKQNQSLVQLQREAVAA